MFPDDCKITDATQLIFMHKGTGEVIEQGTLKPKTATLIHNSEMEDAVSKANWTIRVCYFPKLKLPRKKRIRNKWLKRYCETLY